MLFTLIEGASVVIFFKSHMDDNFFLIILKVDGVWSEWNAWSSCSSVTGDGWRIRARTCSNPSPLNGGHDCVGLSFNSVPCSLIPTIGLFTYN